MTRALLDGIRVLDLTTVVVGPVCTLRLADYGAEVIKVEPPGGDLLRALGGASPSGRHAGSYLHLNRGKRAICLDLKHGDARDALLRVIESSDVVVANMRPEALERLQLDPATLRSHHPRLVYCTITGFGPGGPYRGKPAYDSVVQGSAGVAAAFWAREGIPSYAPMLLSDHIVGEIAAGAILAALVARERSGVGSAIEVPMHETMAAFVLAEHLGPATFRPPLGPPGDRRVLSADNRPVETADGWISLTANSDAQAVSLLRAIGRGDLVDDSRFRTVADRLRNLEEWLGIRVDALRAKTTAEWLEIFSESDVAAMPCHSLDSLLEDPHLVAVDLVQRSVHPTEGDVLALRPTVIVDDEATPAGDSAPPVGWDTHAVLVDAGLTAGEVDALVASGAAIDGRSRNHEKEMT